MKKTILLFIFILFVVLTNNSCSKEEDQMKDLASITSTKLDTITFTHSMKGWELYSWSIDSRWKYSLLIGTNALKSYSQVINNKISVIGEDSIKVILNKLPTGEEIFWIGPKRLESSFFSDPGAFALPPRNIQIEIKEFCDNKNLKLYIAD
jgi:hypothetical protein